MLGRAPRCSAMCPIKAASLPFHSGKGKGQSTVRGIYNVYIYLENKSVYLPYIEGVHQEHRKSWEWNEHYLGFCCWCRARTRVPFPTPFANIVRTPGVKEEVQQPGYAAISRAQCLQLTSLSTSFSCATATFDVDEDAL